MSYDDWLARPYDRLDDDDTCDECKGIGFILREWNEGEEERARPCARCEGKGWIGEPA